MNKTFLHRRSHRKFNYNYSAPGYYFITIVVHNRQMLLGKIVNQTLHLSSAGQIVTQCWLDLSQNTSVLSSEAFVAMPNHVHGIFRIREHSSLQEASAPSIGNLVRSFKAKTCKLVREEVFPEFGWQRDYYDRIIRTDRELRLIQLYIVCNPLLWGIDPENPHKAGQNSTVETSLMKQCGFENEDNELIRRYVEYRTGAR